MSFKIFLIGLLFITLGLFLGVLKDSFLVALPLIILGLFFIQEADVLLDRRLESNKKGERR